MAPVEPQSVRRAGAKPRRRSVDWPVIVDPAPYVPANWFQRLRQDRRSGGWGLLCSVLVHAVVAVACGVWIVTLPIRDDGDPYLISWLRPGAIGGEGAAGPKRQPMRLPVDLGPGAEIEGPKSEPKSMGDAPGLTTAPAVQPVEVGRALTPRRETTGTATKIAGSDDAKQAIRRGLDWLKRVQLSDGRWELHQGYPDPGFSTIKTDTGATGLALLAFLGDGHTHQQGEFADVIKRGLQWLKGIQDPATGDLHDMRYEQGREAAVFSHSLATIALCESLALTADETLREPARRAVNYLLMAQHPDQGGWKYRPIFLESNGDMAVTGWALMALHTARIAGIDVAIEDLQRSSGFLNSVQELNGARYKFEPLYPANYVTPALTAEGLLCRQWLGWPKDYPPQLDAVEYLLSETFRPQWSAGKRNIYGWYFTAQVLHNRGGDEWRIWYLPTRDLIVKHQMKTGKLRGTWHPSQPEGVREEFAEKGGRLYMTAMCLLILETPQRFAPIYAEQE